MKKNILILTLSLISLMSCSQGINGDVSKNVEFQIDTITDPELDVLFMAKARPIKSAFHTQYTTDDKRTTSSKYYFDKAGNVSTYVEYISDERELYSTSAKKNKYYRSLSIINRTLGPSVSPLSLSLVYSWQYSGVEAIEQITNFNKKGNPISRFIINQNNDTIEVQQLSYHQNGELKSFIRKSNFVNGTYYFMFHKGEKVTKTYFNNEGKLLNNVVLAGRDTLYKEDITYFRNGKKQKHEKQSFLQLPEQKADNNNKKLNFINKEHFIEINYDSIAPCVAVYQKAPVEKWYSKVSFNEKNQFISQYNFQTYIKANFSWENDKLIKLETYIPEMSFGRKTKIIGSDTIKTIISFKLITEFNKRNRQIIRYKPIETSAIYHNSDFETLKYIETKDDKLYFSEYAEYDDRNRITLKVNFSKNIPEPNLETYEYLKDSVQVKVFNIKEAYRGKVINKSEIGKIKIFYETNVNRYYKIKTIPSLRFSSNYGYGILRGLKTYKVPIIGSYSGKNRVDYKGLQHIRDENGLLVKIINEGVTTATFNYDYKGSVTEIKKYDYRTGELEKEIEWEYEYYD